MNWKTVSRPLLLFTTVLLLVACGSPEKTKDKSTESNLNTDIIEDSTGESDSESVIDGGNIGDSGNTEDNTLVNTDNSAAERTEGNTEEGAQLYASMCEGCHQSDGRGNILFPGLIENCESTNCQDASLLAAYVESNMPSGNVQHCVGQCR